MAQVFVAQDSDGSLRLMLFSRIENQRPEAAAKNRRQREVGVLLRQLRVAGRPFRKLPVAVINPSRTDPVRSIVASREPSARCDWISIKTFPEAVTSPVRLRVLAFSRPIVHWPAILRPVMVPVAA